IGAKSGDPLAIDVVAKGGVDAGEIDLFVEGPAGAAFGQPTVERFGGGASRPVRLSVPLTSRPKTAGAARLTLTLCAGREAIESFADLDLPAVAEARGRVPALANARAFSLSVNPSSAE
ncbi:MAG: hypothetical protein ABL879_10620, partial [Devosia sp.]